MKRLSRKGKGGVESGGGGLAAGGEGRASAWKPPERCPAPTIICIRKTKTKMAEYPSMAALRAVSKKPRKPAHALPSCCDGGDRR